MSYPQPRLLPYFSTGLLWLRPAFSHRLRRAALRASRLPAFPGLVCCHLLLPFQPAGSFSFHPAWLLLTGQGVNGAAGLLPSNKPFIQLSCSPKTFRQLQTPIIDAFYYRRPFTRRPFRVATHPIVAGCRNTCRVWSMLSSFAFAGGPTSSEKNPVKAPPFARGPASSSQLDRNRDEGGSIPR